MNSFLLWLVGIACIGWMWGVVRNINKQLKGIKMTLDETLASVQAQTTLVSGLSDFVNGLKQRLDEALADQTLTPEAQAKVDAIFTEVGASSQKIADAMAENVPPTEPPPNP